MFELNLIQLILYIFIVHCGYTQLCTETKMIWREVPETYTYTYLEAYEKTNCLFWCTDTRVASAVGTRTTRKLVPVKINVCCPGYVEEKSLIGDGFHCKPLCSLTCHNGYCKSPEVCACNPGYLPDILEPHKCNPICIKGCEHGTCTAPNTCECDSGYESVDGLCKPVCHQPCDNGNCIAPNTCQCHPGYKKSDNGVCETYCSSYTAAGECVVTITCKPGWEKDLEGPFETCKPICTVPCIHGKCISPDECKCFPGYIKSDSDSCIPQCSSGCPQGTCVSPETCACEPGWFQKESAGPCLPHCDNSCGKGTCVAPNTCECQPGYQFKQSMVLEDQINSTLCVPICKNCEGSCVAPEKCICEWPLMAMKVTIDGNPCDCGEDCSGTQDKCDTIICLLPSTTIRNIETNNSVEFATELFLSTAQINSPQENNLNNSKEHIKTITWINSEWLYGIGSVIFIIVIMITAVIIKNKCFRPSSANNDDVTAAVHFKQKSVL